MRNAAVNALIAISLAIGPLTAAAGPLKATHESRFVPVKIEKKTPLALAVIGDSVLWGQGLHEKNKASQDIQEWLAKRYRRPVYRTVYAHSGASIAETDTQFAPSAGEVPQGSPSIVKQVAGAHAPEAVDILLLNGCINDVPSSRIVLGSVNAPDWRKVATKACYEPVKKLLRQALRRFPRAVVVYSGYYPFYTQTQLGTHILRAVEDELLCADEPNASDCREKNDAEVAPGVVRSKEWHEGSNAAISKAIDEIQVEFPKRKIGFATIALDVDDGYGSADSKLWHVIERDDAHDQRLDDCKDTKREAKKGSKKRFGIYCHRAAVLHPNRAGAKLYTKAIRKELEELMPEPETLDTDK